MDDDGIILNLDTSHFNPASTTSSTHHLASQIKGSWKKKRVIAKKIVRNQARSNAYANSNSNSNNNSSARGNGNPNHTETGSSSSLSRPPKKFTSSNNKDGSSSGKKRPFISSLFSSNPEDEATKPDEPETPNTEQGEGAAPTNAPIDSSSFAGIGVHPSLCTHLSTKLSISAPTSIQQKAIPVLLNSSNTKETDMVIHAQTGSGKTLTFLLPMVHRLISVMANEEKLCDRSLGVLALVLAPTRELARQIYDVLDSLLKFIGSGKHWVVPGLVVGGDKKKSEKARLRKGVNVLVSTPGRLLDHLENTKSMKVEHCRWVVLDEADKLLELGFEEQLKGIFSILNEKTKMTDSTKVPSTWPLKRQTILCSATMQDRLYQFLSSTPVVIKDDNMTTSQSTSQSSSSSTTPNEDAALSIPKQLTQSYMIAPAKLRLVTLAYMLRHLLSTSETTEGKMKIIVFLSCCDSVEFHHALLNNQLAATKPKSPMKKRKRMVDSDISDSEETPELQSAKDYSEEEEDNEDEDTFSHEIGLPSDFFFDASVFSLHGNMPSAVRQDTYKKFISSDTSILLTTDVASRGLDLKHVHYIIQYDPATDVKEYVHRVGRTARVGAKGEAILFLLPSEMEYLGLLNESGLPSLNEYRISLQQLVINAAPKTLSTTSKQKKSSKDWETIATDLQMRFERLLVHRLHANMASLARKAFFSHIRSYATHSSAEKFVFHVKKLHLGHLAKAFALRETPKEMIASEAKAKAAAKAAKSNSSKNGRNNGKEDDKPRNKSVTTVSGVSTKVIGGKRIPMASYGPNKSGGGHKNKQEAGFFGMAKKRSVSEFGDGFDDFGGLSKKKLRK